MLYILSTIRKEFKQQNYIISMIKTQLLRKLGFTNNEIEIYFILLKLKESLASKISEETQISRPHVYDSLNKLMNKGLASYIIKNNKKHFRATNPEKLLDYIKEKEAELKQNEKSIRKILPELNSLYKPLKEKPIVEVYEGSEGIKTILFDIIKVRKEMISFNTLGKEFFEHIPEHVIKRYINERKNKKIKSRQFYTDGTKIFKHSMVKYKKLPTESSQVTLSVYGDNVVMFVLSEPILAIKIKDKNVAKLYKNQFEIMWKLIK